MFDIVLKIILFLSPICYPVGMQLEVFDINFFRVASVVLLSAYLLEKKPVREISVEIKYLIASLLGIGVFNVFINTFHPVVLSSLFNLQLACLDLYLIVTGCRNHKSIFKWIVYAGLINILIFLIQRIGYDFIFNDVRNTVGDKQQGGMLGNLPRFTTYLALIIPFVFDSGWIVFGLFCLISLLTMQFPIILCAFTVLFLRSDNRWQKIVLFSGLGIFCVVFYRHILTAFGTRWNQNWKFTLERLFNRPLLGYGMGANPIRDNAEVISNSFLQFIIQVGSIGIVWLIYAAKKLRFSKDIETGALFSMFALMMIEYPLAIQKLWLTMIAIVAFAIIKMGGRDVGSLQG
jgi:hypothetical protein